ncbi:hypothetical protein Deipr_1807 [Deinococcus proteolyticus MRP]|uniref:Uncharacterized protein n=1 Tax=Deinococcus proteolyticus (strain ATCC 35074 / DSM 20540 / JCM 6276 / NBRC 101906 / NCIMB 13154 / VKM Ac-1939 / CCM 2703 / MRP) TaxID=693977 RepID=F0RLL5_DEIPM|nr:MULTISPECIES: hypothetical protein [Deinococcus]ADY26939.1 hypothetical protein Deipr_1807 [Deinococcus proteolyticus MRP]MCY1703066.1 hypothetical protein [Deinococcus sp. SL84]
MSDELNFAHTILQGRAWRDVPDHEVLAESERLLGEWMSGEVRMERPKLYDHYALLLLALTRQNRELSARVAALEAAAGQGERAQDS